MEDELPAGAVPTPFVSPNGTTTQVTWTLVPDPNGVLVCDVPHYDMRPQPPLDRLLDALPPLEFQDQTVLVPLVSIGQSTKSLDQHTVWVRIQ